jgi:hypothetical protein
MVTKVPLLRSANVAAKMLAHRAVAGGVGLSLTPKFRVKVQHPAMVSSGRKTP